MMKKILTTTCLSACAAGSVIAGNCSDGVSPFVSAKAGYMFDLEEPYVVGNFGLNLDNCDKLSIQVIHVNADDQEVVGLVFPADFEFTTVGLSYQGHLQAGDNGRVYLGGSVGAAFVDAEATFMGVTGQDSDTTLYFDLTAGIEQQLSENWAFNFGGRAIFMDDFKVSDQGITIIGPDKDGGSKIYFGLEAGFTYNF